MAGGFACAAVFGRLSASTLLRRVATAARPGGASSAASVRRMSDVAVDTITDKQWRYRKTFFRETNRPIHWMGEAIMGIFWYYMLICFYYKFELVSGDPNYPDPRTYTDEQLGIPPDDEEDVPRIV